MASNILDLADKVVTDLNAAWTDQGANDGVSREWIAPLSDADLLVLAGRKVYVVPPVAYSDDPATRGEDFHDYSLIVLIVEKYADAGLPTKAWIDARTTFVENIIVPALGTQRTRKVIGTRKLSTQRVVVSVVDLELLERDNLFQSVISVEFQELLPA